MTCLLKEDMFWEKSLLTLIKLIELFWRIHALKNKYINFTKVCHNNFFGGKQAPLLHLMLTPKCTPFGTVLGYFRSKQDENHHWILHIRINRGSKLEPQQKILSYGTNFQKRGFFQPKTG